MTTLFSAYTALCALVLLICAVFFLSKSPRAGLFLIFGLYLLDAAYQSQMPGFTLVGVTVYPTDVGLGLLGLIGGGRLLSRPQPWLWPVAALVLGVLFAALRGLELYPLQTVVNSARPTFYLLGATVYAATLDWGPVLRVWLSQQWLRFSLLILGVGVVWFFLNLTGVATYSEYQGTFRFLGAGYALLFAQTVVLAFLLAAHGDGRRVMWTAYLMLAAVIILQHRTVWLAVLATVPLFLLTERRVRGPLMRGLLVAGLAVAALAEFVFPSQLSSALSTSATSEGTFLWRLDGWAQLLSPERFGNPVSVLFGQPLGAGYERVVGGQVVHESPHNVYVQTLVDFGVFGLIAYLSLLWLVFRRTGALGRWDPQFRALQLATAMVVVYGGAYTPPYIQGLLFGLGLCALRVARPSFSPARAVPLPLSP